MKYLLLYLQDPAPQLIVWPSDEVLPSIFIENIREVKVFPSMTEVREYIYTNIPVNDRFRMHAMGFIEPMRLYC